MTKGSNQAELLATQAILLQQALSINGQLTYMNSGQSQLLNPKAVIVEAAQNMKDTAYAKGLNLKLPPQNFRYSNVSPGVSGKVANVSKSEDNNVRQNYKNDYQLSLLIERNSLLRRIGEIDRQLELSM